MAIHMAIQRMSNACCVPEATNTHSGCIMLIALPLQQWLDERTSLLRDVYIVCLVKLLRFTLFVGCWVALAGCYIHWRVLERIWVDSLHSESCKCSERHLPEM